MDLSEAQAGQGRSVRSGNGRPLLVGRARELLVLRAQLAETLAGNGSIVVFGGEAGIGKSRLADALCREASDAGALVLSGHCYDFSVTPPYGPWEELVERYGSLPDRPGGPTAAPVPQFTHGGSHTALFREIRDFLFAVARDRPLVILLEDVHWADAESLELLRFVARQLTQVPILLLVTYCNDNVARAHPLHWLVPILVREALAVRIDVSPLVDDDVRALIDHTYRLPAEATARLATHLQQRAEGNPFFVVELLRSLEGSVLLATEQGDWALGALEPTGIPTFLRQVIDQRLSRIGKEAESLLAIGAVIGQIVPFELWAKVSGTSEATLLDLVERAVAGNIMDAVADGTAARFTHALIRDALYDSVLPPRRRLWHRQIAEGLLEMGAAAGPDEVAYHLDQAGDRRASEWLTRAGERAQNASAWRTATQRYEAALALIEEDPAAASERGWLRVRLALLRRFENPGAGIVLLEEAERLGQIGGDRALEACARFYQGMLRCQRDDYRLGIAAEEAGVAMLDALSPQDRARLLAIETAGDPLDAQNGRGELTLALAESGRLQQARALGEHIISLPADQTSGALGDAFYGLGYTYAALGQPDAARQALHEARECFAAVGHWSMVTASLWDELIIVLLPYQLDRAAERTRLENELIESFAALDGITDQRSVRAARMAPAVLAGEWANAFDLLEQSDLRFMQRGIPMLLAPVARARGDTARAWSLILQHFPAGPDTAPGDSAIDAVSLRSLAVELALDAGDHKAARRWLESFDTWLSWSGSVLGQAGAQLCWARYYRSIGENQTARARASQALTAASTPRQPTALLAAHRFLGELDLEEGRLPEAQERFETAMQLADAIGSAYEQVLTSLGQADLLHAQGRIAAARERLDTVRARCLTINAVHALARVEELDARWRFSPDPVSRPPAGLTPREAEVLRLLATGLPNAKIARQLSLSPRTIDTHLTSVYAKLGVTTRGAAIRFALEHDLSQDGRNPRKSP